MVFQRVPRLLVRHRTLLTAVGATTVAGGVLLYQATKPTVRHERPVALARDANGQIVPPTFPRMRSRAEQLADLRRHGASPDSEGEYDLVVIGGGATGTGIALDAATRGLRVALVERGDFASGTSSKSTKLVHGGVRYLEKAFWELDWGQVQLVREALAERRTFLDIAPHLSRQLPILLPLYKWWQAGYFRAGTVAYDLLAGSEGLQRSYLMGRTRAMEEFPLLKKEGLFGALVYFDGQHNDSRMNTCLATTAALYGATVANYVEVTSLEKNEAGKISGVKVRDCLPGAKEDEFLIRAKGVINATGPFSDAIRGMDEPTGRPMVAPSSGVHVILPRHFSPKTMGALDAATSDGRLLFILPWEGRTIAGTTDNACPVEDQPEAHDEDIDFILKEVRKMLGPDAELSRDDVLAAWSGIRPLVREPNAKNTESLVRSHLVTKSASGLLTCAGGKWTTYRHMAEEAVDEAIKTFNLKPGPLPKVAVGGPQAGSDLDAASSLRPGTCITKQVKLVGAHGWHVDVEGGLEAALKQKYGLEADVAEHLALNYGDRAWQLLESASSAGNGSGLERLSPAFPFVAEEVRHGVRNEYAQTAADVLARRMRLAFLDVRAALDALPGVIDILAAELKWSRERRETEWTETMRFLESMGLPAELRSLGRDEVLRRRATRPAPAPAGDAAGARESRGWVKGAQPILAKE